MTHIVIGYPDLDTSMRTVEAMVEAGVDLMELQIPFSEPIADGPVILHANQKALGAGVTVADCFEFAETCVRRFDIPFLFMSYYNILFRYGVDAFVERMASIGLRGAIVPDLPPEEGDVYLSAMETAGLDPIFIYSPNTPDARLAPAALSPLGARPAPRPHPGRRRGPPSPARTLTHPRPRPSVRRQEPAHSACRCRRR